jgi:hypothetical protein
MTLVGLQRDTYFGVRRAAFRALAQINPAFLFSIIATLSHAEDPGARMLSAEALFWIPKSGREHKWREFHDLLLNDPVGEVRGAVGVACAAAKRRDWGATHLSQLTALENDDNDDNDVIMRVWKHAEALTRTGDDEAAECLREHLACNSLAPHLRFLLVRTLNALEKNWAKVRKKWPEPMLPVQGAIESGFGQITSLGVRHDVHYTVWREIRADPNPQFPWGGTAEFTKNDFFTATLLGAEVSLHLTDDREGKIVVHSIRNDSVFAFTGLHQFPQKRVTLKE